MGKIRLVDVTPDNVQDEGVYCLQNPRAPGFQRKLEWFNKRHQEGLRLKVLRDQDDKQVGFIESVPAEYAWRPVHAPRYLFIQCILIARKQNVGLGYGSMLVKAVESDARESGKAGVATMTSSGVWMVGQPLFLKRGYKEVDAKERFVLLAKSFAPGDPAPVFLDWEKQRKKYAGWHLVYADQCPWHEKAAVALAETAAAFGVDLNIKKLTTARQAQAAPSGYGVFNLLHDGRLLEDHYVSATRFKSILKNELVQA